MVKNNPGDILLTRETLKEGKVLNNLHVAVDGVGALDYLKREGQFTNAVQPDIILLDLN